MLLDFVTKVCFLVTARKYCCFINGSLRVQIQLLPGIYIFIALFGSHHYVYSTKQAVVLTGGAAAMSINSDINAGGPFAGLNDDDRPRVMEVQKIGFAGSLANKIFPADLRTELGIFHANIKHECIRVHRTRTVHGDGIAVTQ